MITYQVSQQVLDTDLEWKFEREKMRKKSWKQGIENLTSIWQIFATKIRQEFRTKIQKWKKGKKNRESKALKISLQFNEFFLQKFKILI